MNLDLNHQEIQYLQNLVDQHLLELSHEIGHTDHRDFKEELKNEVEVMRMLQQKLQAENWSQ